MPQELGYNTNGFAHHRLEDAIDILAEIGYSAVALTLDYHALDPFSPAIWQETQAIKRRLQEHNMCCVVETGARFLLDPRRKHQPSLLSSNEDDRARRFDFLCRALEVAAYLDAEALSFWSGAKDPSVSDDEAWPLLIDACDALLGRAVHHQVLLAFEPEPNMFIERMAGFARLSEELNHPRFGLTLDIGHVHCLDDGAPADRIREFSKYLFNVHVEDMRHGVHDHLMFGGGEIDFAPIFGALDEVQYVGTVNVELSRHSYDAVNTAHKAYAFLNQFNR